MVTLYGLLRERRRDAWVLHTRQVQLALAHVLADVRDAEVGQRGYLMTGDSAYLQPYTRGVDAVRVDAAEIIRLTRDNPLQSKRANLLAGLITRRTDRLRNNLQLSVDGFRDSAIANARLDTGRVLMDSLRSTVAVMTATEDTLLLRRQENQRRQENLTILIVVAGALLAAGFALLMNMMMRGITRELQRNTAALTSQNEKLAEQALELEQQSHHLQEQAIELEMQRDELKEASVELEARTEAAENANRAKSDFLRAMSHELRTPLNAIGGYAQLIELGIRGPVTPEQHEDLSRITRSQRHLLSLINDILNYAKIEAGHVNYETLDISVHEMILAMDELVRPQMLAKHITYECDAGPQDLLVRVDPEKTLQVMLNLLSNAVKFTPSDGLIKVWVAQNDGMAEIHVRDSGVGIAADRLEAIFEPFVQVGRTLSGASEGTGLGLSISRDLARGMKGDLLVESELGRGSTFTLILPTTARAVR